MNKGLNKGLIAGVVIAIFGISYIIIQPSKESVTAEIKNITQALGTSEKNKKQAFNPSIDADAKEQKVERQQDGRLVIKGSLPRELKPIREALEQATSELKQTAIDDQQQESELQNSYQETDRLIAQADQLVAETNQRLGLDTSHIAEAMKANTPLAAEFKAIETQMDEISRAALDINKN